MRGVRHGYVHTEEGPDGKEALRDARSERGLAATMLVCASECKSESKSKSEGSRDGWGRNLPVRSVFDMKTLV